MKTKFNKMTVVVTLIISAFLSGCAGQQTRIRCSVVDYLYPKGSEKIIHTSVPVLNIPIKVGIAFVPEQSSHSTGVNYWTGAASGEKALTEANKINLLENVANNFRKYDFVSEIEIIPSAYLTPGGSFSNLEQIRTMHGIDLIALVSYDQVQFTDEGLLSFSYWTLVGAYVISGEKNDTSTMLDTVVYDIESQKMLFRAPGTSSIKGKSTPVNLSEKLREDSLAGFQEATNNMIINLDIQLSGFREKIKQNPEKVKVVHHEEYSGGGVWGVSELALTFSMLLICLINHLINQARKARKNPHVSS